MASVLSASAKGSTALFSVEDPAFRNDLVAGGGYLPKKPEERCLEVGSADKRTAALIAKQQAVVHEGIHRLSYRTDRNAIGARQLGFGGDGRARQPFARSDLGQHFVSKPLIER